MCKRHSNLEATVLQCTCVGMYVEKVKRTRTKIKKDNKPKDKRETRANVRGKKHAVNLLAARILKAHQ